MSAWIVVVNYGAHALIEQNFASEPALAEAKPRLVVVDNYFSADERSAMEAACRRHGWIFVARATNDGFGAACNAGVQVARRAGARNVVLVNPDALVTEPVIAALGVQLDAEPMTLISPVVVTSTGGRYFEGSQIDLRRGRMRGRRWPDQVPDRVYLQSDPPYRDWLSGACLAFSVQLWELAGGLAEHYFLYWEDVDFSQRCVAAGARLCLRRDLVVVHDEGATHGAQGARARSPLYYFYNCRNRLVYGAVQLPRVELLRWLVTTPSESWQILLRGGRRQLLRSPRPLWAAVTGSLSGLVRAVPAFLRRGDKRLEPR